MKFFNNKAMILELLILLFLLWIWSGGFTMNFSHQIDINQEPIVSDREVLLHLINDLNSLFEDPSSIPSYKILSSRDRTFVANKETIYLVLRHSNDDLFDYPTILQAAIHEMAHILCTETGHSDNFYQIEDYLIQQAIKRQLLSNGFYPDPDYPCQDE